MTTERCTSSGKATNRPSFPSYPAPPAPSTYSSANAPKDLSYAGVPLREVQTAAHHADPRTTTIYDHRRHNFDRHATYVVVAYVTGG
ncbi:MAG: hypothetical protein GY713_13550 [Actinomycetia bacterium]|nr:hypothetical protein [Actinomycetes bacterium]